MKQDLGKGLPKTRTLKAHIISFKWKNNMKNLELIEYCWEKFSEPSLTIGSYMGGQNAKPQDKIHRCQWNC